MASSCGWGSPEFLKPCVVEAVGNRTFDDEVHIGPTGVLVSLLGAGSAVESLGLQGGAVLDREFYVDFSVGPGCAFLPRDNSKFFVGQFKGHAANDFPGRRANVCGDRVAAFREAIENQHMVRERGTFPWLGAKVEKRQALLGAPTVEIILVEV